MILFYREAKLYDRAEKFYKLATVNAPQVSTCNFSFIINTVLLY